MAGKHIKRMPMFSLNHNNGRVQVLAKYAPEYIADIDDQEASRRIVLHGKLLAALKGIEPHAFGHSQPDCKGKARDPENCKVCKSIWAARDVITEAEGRS